MKIAGRVYAVTTSPTLDWSIAIEFEIVGRAGDTNVTPVIERKLVKPMRRTPCRAGAPSRQSPTGSLG